MAGTKTTFWKIAGLVLVWRVLLLGVGAGADALLPYKPSFPYAYERLALLPLPRWLYSWVNFDGVHYLTIAKEGYLGTGSVQAFFPVFPLLLRIFVAPPVVGGLVLNLFLTIGMTGMLYFLARLDASELAARWTVVGLLLFPTSFYFGALYTESLFLLLVFGSFYSARQKNWLMAGLLAGIASGTRIIGIALVPALLVELWLQARPVTFRSWLAVLYRTKMAIGLSVAGFVAYSAYLWRTFGDPLFFFHVQESFGAGRQTSLVLFPQVLWRSVKILWSARPFDWKYFSYAQDLIVSVGTLGVFLAAFKKIRPSYLVFSAVAFFLPPLTGTLSSMPRYVLACFPLFVLFGHWAAGHRKPAIFLLTVGALMLIINTVLFIQGYWVA